MSAKSKQKATQKHDPCCRFTYADGRRCQMPRRSRRAPFCLHHWRQQQQLLNAGKLAKELLGPHNEFKTATAVNHVLGKAFILVARDRLPVRHAAVLGYLGQLLLQSLTWVESEFKTIYDGDSWNDQMAHELEREYGTSEEDDTGEEEHEKGSQEG